MQECYFAGYRMLVDDEISEHESMLRLSTFRKEMPYTHTFTVRMGDEALLDEKYVESQGYTPLFSTEDLAFYDAGDTWRIVRILNERALENHMKNVVIASKDYGEMTVYMLNEPFYWERGGQWIRPIVPFSSSVRAICEAGMVMRGGLPLHASLVEKDGQGIVFLGPSGMGKSTQAKLWVAHQNADFIIGDRPVLRCIDGTWHGFGMPWDGKDNIKNQKTVPIRALVSLKQAGENSIERLTEQQAMLVLLKQAMMPMWDNRAMESAMALMGRLAMDIPFYHLKNLPDKNATDITYRAVFEGKDHG